MYYTLLHCMHGSAYKVTRKWLQCDFTIGSPFALPLFPASEACSKSLSCVSWRFNARKRKVKHHSELLRVSQRLSLALVMRHFLSKDKLWEEIGLRALEFERIKCTAYFGREEDTVGNPHRAQISQLSFFELILLLKLNKQFPVE